MNRLLFKLVAWLGVFIVLSLTASLLWNRAWLPTFRPIIVAEIIIGKTNLAVVQTHDGFGFYGTSLVVKDDGNWKWFYLDHDTGYWWNAKLRYEDQDGTVRILRGTRLVARFSPDKGVGFNTPKGLVYHSPGGWIEGDLFNNWNRLRPIPDKQKVNSTRQP